MVLLRTQSLSTFVLKRFHVHGGIIYFHRFKSDDSCPINEPVRVCKKGSFEYTNIHEVLNKRSKTMYEVPIVIGDKHFNTEIPRYQHCPYDFAKLVATYSYAPHGLIKNAIHTALNVRKTWEATPLSERAKIFQKAADILSRKKRYDIMASTMIGQAKNMYEAEIDAVCELVDFLRFDSYFATKLLDKYVPFSTADANNCLQIRGLEGFVAVLTPFNFTAIGGHLPAVAALMGNVVIWKPSDHAIDSNYVFYETLLEAGLPPGVINFVPSDGTEFVNAVTESEHLAGLLYVGSTSTLKRIWTIVGDNIDRYRCFPRISGECGGKNFHLIHVSANIETAVDSTIKAAYGYSGQKCSACSRLYVSESIWTSFLDQFLKKLEQLKVGPATDEDIFTSAVISSSSYDRINKYIEYAKSSSNINVMHCRDSEARIGYFIYPALFQSADPADLLMRDEIFGPILTAFVYEDNRFDEVLQFIDKTTPFGLTGSIFATDEEVINKAVKELRYSAGNLYINDKCTGSIVNQQPFGGSRLSGTNDKAGSTYFLHKLCDFLTIKTKTL